MRHLFTSVRAVEKVEPGTATPVFRRPGGKRPRVVGPQREKARVEFMLACRAAYYDWVTDAADHVGEG